MNKILISIVLCASVAFSADLTITAMDYKRQYPQKHKTIILKGKKGTAFETTTNSSGIARVQISDGDTYSFWCDGITGEFDCGFGNTLSVPHGASSGTWEIFYDDDHFELKGLNFDVNKATMKAGYDKILMPAVKGLQKYDTVKVEISGHTDSDGDDEKNQKLSEDRANAVRDYLIRKGIAADRIVARGYGESRPIADNRTAQGKALNRRIEILRLN